MSMADLTRRSSQTPDVQSGFTSASLSYPSYVDSYGSATASRPRTGAGWSTRWRPSTARPRTRASTIGVPDQELICAISESRGISPTVGLALINLDTGEAVLSQISDSQTYARTLNKLRVYSPSQILVPSTAADPPSKLFYLLEDDLDDIHADLITIDRRYFAESTGFEGIERLAFLEDIAAIKILTAGNYFAVCCFAAALNFIELQLGKTFQPHSLRVKYEPSEGTMMIDVATVCALELIQNIHDSKSKLCLYGLLKQTLTPMGARLLRSTILQPSTKVGIITKRYDAVEELSTKEELFSAVHRALKPFIDVEKLLTSLIVVEARCPMAMVEDSINKVIMLKHYVQSIIPVHESLTSARGELLVGIRDNCSSEELDQLLHLINETINRDTQYCKTPLELRNQRTYAVKSGINGLLDVARTAYKEFTEDAYRMVEELREIHKLSFELKFDNQRHMYIRCPAAELEARQLPPIVINVIKSKKYIECQTLDLMKLNQKLTVCHEEILAMSDSAVQELIGEIRSKMSILFKCCESIAVLDMLTAFADLVTKYSYVRPTLTDTLAIKSGRHPVREAFHTEQYVANDVFASQQNRFQIITGCNMSGKSTYIRSIALMTVMAQIGSFVPADFASFPVMHQLFARVNMDDSIEANVSTFAAEMRETAFILRNIDQRSVAIVDELGRGTSTRDGLAIALAIAEALVDSRAIVWFVTHFRDIATIMAERAGVVNLHLAVELGDENGPDAMNMLYKIAEGSVQELHYGLKLARVMPLPARVLDVAEQVATKLDLKSKQTKETSAAVIREKKRRLVLSLNEHLVQAKNGVMDGPVLAEWLRQLQREFVIRMMAIETEAENALELASNPPEASDG